MSTQPANEALHERPSGGRPPAETERWRCPAALRVKSLAAAAASVAVAAVFFPAWFGIPVAALLGAWGLGVAVLGASVTVDGGAGVVVLRMGLIARRIRLTDVTAVLVEESKVSLGRANGGEVSLYAWRKGPLDALLRLPAEAGDIGHAISRAAAIARAYDDGAGDGAAGADGTGQARAAGAGRASARARSRLATVLLGAAGALAIAGALLVRVHWDSTAMTVLGVVIALALGVSGLLYLLVALWILLTGHAPRFTSAVLPATAGPPPGRLSRAGSCRR